MINDIFQDYYRTLAKGCSVTVESEVPENNIKQPQATDGIKPQLRTVDLNLLTVFDAVMQEQNITRASQNLGMSKPAVSRAFAWIKSKFNEEL
jgi:LysR family transcriptional activator for leuABCD operon